MTKRKTEIDQLSLDDWTISLSTVSNLDTQSLSHTITQSPSHPVAQSPVTQSPVATLSRPVTQCLPIHNRVVRWTRETLDSYSYHTGTYSTTRRSSASSSAPYIFQSQREKLQTVRCLQLLVTKPPSHSPSHPVTHSHPTTQWFRAGPIVITPSQFGKWSFISDHRLSLINPPKLQRLNRSLGQNVRSEVLLCSNKIETFQEENWKLKT
jgi:hypothetical protein